MKVPIITTKPFGRASRLAKKAVILTTALALSFSSAFSKRSEPLPEGVILSQSIPSTTQYMGDFNVKKTFELDEKNTGEYTITGKVTKTQQVLINSLNYERNILIFDDNQKNIISLYGKINSENTGVYHIEQIDDGYLKLVASTYETKIDTTYKFQQIEFSNNAITITQKDGTEFTADGWTANVSYIGAQSAEGEVPEHNLYTLNISKQFSPAYAVNEDNFLQLPASELLIGAEADMPKFGISFTSVAEKARDISKYNHTTYRWEYTTETIPASLKGDVYVDDIQNTEYNKFLYVGEKDFGFAVYPENSTKFLMEIKPELNEKDVYTTKNWYLAENGILKDKRWHEAIPQITFSNKSPPYITYSVFTFNRIATSRAKNEDGTNLGDRDNPLFALGTATRTDSAYVSDSTHYNFKFNKNETGIYTIDKNIYAFKEDTSASYYWPYSLVGTSENITVNGFYIYIPDSLHLSIAN